MHRVSGDHLTAHTTASRALLRASIPSRRVGPKGSASLDLFRAVAAFLVMIGHLRTLFFVDYADVEMRTVVIQAIYFVTGLGHQAVMAFFVLSGFFISANIFRAMNDGRWGWGWYLGRRITRLYVVLLPALVIGLLLDHLGLRLFGIEGPYGGGPGYQRIFVPDRLDWIIFLGNAAYLQDILVPTFGSNGPLWSLSYEFWYYLLFPCLVLVTLGRGAGTRLAHGVAAVAIVVLVGERVLLFFTIWLFGVAAFLAPTVPALARRGFWRCAAFIVVGILFLGLLGAGKLRILPQTDMADIALGFACALLVYLLGRTPSDPSRSKGAFDAFAHLAASFSYTLYLTHLPALIFLCAWLTSMGNRHWQPDLLHGAYGLVIAGGTLLYAFGVAQLTEARTDRVRKALFGSRGG